MNMSKELDKLFKDKLADHALSAPAEAWTRIEAGLSKKNNRPVALRIAAGVLLLSILAATILWLSSRDTINSSIPLATKAPEKKSETTMKAPEARTKAVQPATAKHNKE